MDQATESAFALLQSRLAVLERKVDFMLAHFNLAYTPAIPDHMKPIAALLQAGKRDEAIDAFCESTGAGLAQAKAAIAELTLLLSSARR